MEICFRNTSQSGIVNPRQKMKLDDYKDILEPFERLVEIKIDGTKHKVPENNALLRCFQYLSLETISMGEFCWNGDCLNCQVWVKKGRKEKLLMSCRARVEEGMEIVRTADEIIIDTESS